MDTEKDTVLQRQAELQRLYLRNMQIIKWRLNAIRDIQLGKTKTTYFMTNIEFCVLQIRKILELIALSALISDQDVYDAQLKNIGSMWNAKWILSDIERIHPDFFPRPIIISPDNKNDWQDREEDYLTKEEFIRIYEKCGKFLHENPLKMTNADIDYAYGEVEKDITKWGTRIVNLLSTHIVNLYNQKNVFFISMGNENDAPFGNIFEKMEAETLD